MFIRIMKTKDLTLQAFSNKAKTKCFVFQVRILICHFCLSDWAQFEVVAT